MSLYGTDLNLLIALRALLEEEHVTRAGDRIKMGQSSTSAALSRLRVQFNDELLVRVGRDYQLTPLAKQLLPQVQLTIPLIEKALGIVSDFDPAQSTRTFTLMMSDFAALELAPLFHRALEMAPHVAIDVLPLPAQPTESQRDMLKHDFAAAVPGIGIDGDHKEIFRDHYVCLVAQDNPAISKGKLSWEAFIALPQAVSDFGHAHLTPSDRKLRELGFRREAHVTTSGLLPLPSIVSGTDLVALVPSRLAARFGDLTDTVGIEPPFGRVDIIETLYWHPTHNTDSAHLWLRDVLTREAA